MMDITDKLVLVKQVHAQVNPFRDMLKGLDELNWRHTVLNKCAGMALYILKKRIYLQGLADLSIMGKDAFLDGVRISFDPHQHLVIINYENKELLALKVIYAVDGRIGDFEVIEDSPALL